MRPLELTLRLGAALAAGAVIGALSASGISTAPVCAPTSWSRSAPPCS
jgi:hypothetical protein